jgi:hypothetical protein
MLEDAVQADGKLILGDLKRNGAILQPHLIDYCRRTATYSFTNQLDRSSSRQGSMMEYKP